MPEITFLERSELTGENKLDIFNQIGIEAKITDFAILTGGALCDPYGTIDLDKRCGYYWTKTKIMNGVYAVDFEGDIDYENARINNNCIRPVLKNVSKLGTKGHFLPGNNYVYFY